MKLSKVHVLGTGLSGRGEVLANRVKNFQLNPAFRKASRNMIAANIAIEEAVSDAGLGFHQMKEAGFVLGSSYGEIESTTEFLKNWARSRFARPMLFQSSLHNGTLGFLALHLSLPGPSFTLSQQFFTGEKSLELGADLIRAGVVDLALVCAVDVMAPVLFPALIPHLPVGVEWADGAAAVLLASDSWVNLSGKAARGELLRVEAQINQGKAPGEDLKGVFYDSDGLEKWIVELRNGKTTSLRNVKPDHTSTQIDWRF